MMSSIGGYVQRAIQYLIQGSHMDKLLEIFSPNLEENTQNLRQDIEFLGSRKDDVDEILQDAASHSGKKRKREVEDWTNNVGNNIKKFKNLELRVQESNRFYHLIARQDLDKQIERMTKEVKRLVDQSAFPCGLFLDIHEQNCQILLTSEPNGQAFQQNLDDICTSLKDDKILTIGIYGMGGVGKTTLAMRAHDKLLNESMFSGHVYWVTVSQEFSIYKLQSDIAQALKLDITNENDERKRAAELFQAFQRRERCVLILDDVWKEIDTMKIGIPIKPDGFNLLITSRSVEVCNHMSCKKIIKVNTLSEQAALDLFLETLDCDELSSRVKQICKKMVNRCGGLPLALVTLARSMRGVTDIHEWRDALGSLEVSYIGRSNIGNEVLSILLYSYDRLRDKKLKNCFLYCSLYPEDSRISRDELIEKFILEELMEGRSSYQEEVDQGHAILNQLERACLLERVTDQSFKMHDLIREMAIEITKYNPRYMVKAGLYLKELPEEQNWTEDLDKVSLMNNRIDEISSGTSPKCPRLSTLILSNCNRLLLIPDCFFTQMCGLRTLDLSFTRIKSLPNSISDLEKLNALLLHDCYRLASVPSLEKLKVLRHLNLSFTKIEIVPQGMESLSNLKSLNLDCLTLKMIPARTLRRLTHLQRLILPCHLEVPVQAVEALKHLEVFQGCLGSTCDLNRLIKSRQSDKQLFLYRIKLGSTGILCFDSKFQLRCKYVSLEEGSFMESSLGTDENLLPQNIETLIFTKSGFSGCLLDTFPILNDATDLKICEIRVEQKTECIIRLPSAGVPFQSLETLQLTALPNFIGLFKWEAYAPLPPGTFSCLKRISINTCHKIKKLFPRSLVHNFHNLQELIVRNCKQMEEIIEDDNNEGDDITWPSLKKLELRYLPQLKSNCIGNMICSSSANEEQRSTGVPFQSLETLLLEDLPNVIGLFNLEAFAPLPPGTFSCLKWLSIFECHKIKKLFPRSLVHNFHNLQKLRVELCKEMEEIIEDDNNEGADITWPSLKKLKLARLPQLKGNCIGNMICSSSANEERSTGVPFQSLETLHLEDLPNVIGLFNLEAFAPLPAGTFSCLKWLIIVECHKIKKLFPRSLVHNFHNLQELIVMYCEEMEEIIEDDNNEGLDITFPSLKKLELFKLPQLRRNYRKHDLFFVCE